MILQTRDQKPADEYDGRGRESSPTARNRDRLSPQAVLAQAQEGRFLIEDFTPLANSLEFDLGGQYWRERGSKAFISDARPVPYAINNDGGLSRRAAEVFFASLVEAETLGPLEPTLYVLELGIGVGLFARFFLDAFRDLCARESKDYYERLVYIAGDRSERMLADACRHGVFANHPGRYRLRVVDALQPQVLLRDVGMGEEGSTAAPLTPDPSPLTPNPSPQRGEGREAPSPQRGEGSVDPSPQRGDGRRLRAVFLNYLLDCLPAAHLRMPVVEASGDGAENEQARWLCVRTCLARHVPLAEYTTLTAADLARLARGTPADRKRLMEVYGLFASEYDYRPIPDGAELPYLDCALAFGKRHGLTHLLHSYGALQCLDRVLELVAPGAPILVNDYGSVEAAPPGEFEHQRFSHATGVGVNFALLKAYFGATGRCRWIEPDGENGNIVSRLLTPAVRAHESGGSADMPAAAEQLFAQRFGKAAWEWRQEPWDGARAHVQQRRFETALTAYHRALDRQPGNWILVHEIAAFLTSTLPYPLAGVALAKEAVALNPACSAELWNTLGDAYYKIGRLDQAKSAFRRALRINPSDVRGRYNLAWVLLAERRYGEALAVIAEALALDETGEWYEGLLKKQNEVLGRLAQRNQHRQFLLANRVSSRPGGEPSGQSAAAVKTAEPQTAASHGN